MKNICPLCHTQAENFYQDTQRYYQCPKCRAVFVDEDDLPRKSEEKERYELHDTDTQDSGYRKFVSPIISNILKDFTSDAEGLDFGAGTSAIISEVLSENSYNIKNYDPYFHNNPELLEKKYDYISACEVIEHFYKPQREFHTLRKMLKSGAKLYLMTDIYDGRDFASWYYKNDPTHVFLYTAETFEYIKQEYNFRKFSIEKRLVIFSL
ncbi:methyltransferase domain-containing protein [Sulfurimonas sp.]